ncbi:hypothetical protein Tco_0548421 [Tanacetum coccineum]
MVSAFVYWYVLDWSFVGGSVSSGIVCWLGLHVVRLGSVGGVWSERLLGGSEGVVVDASGVRFVWSRWSVGAGVGGAEMGLVVVCLWGTIGSDRGVLIGPLVWPTITVDGATRPKEYTKLTASETIQVDCDIKAINFILQGIPPEIYALVSQHRVAKDIWEKIQLLMQGTSLTKQERECKLYDEFDKFTYKTGESLHEYYLRFTLLLNDMNIYKMPLEQFQVNTKFLNTLPAEWSKFVTDVKLVKDLHTTNVDQIHAHLEQHERHANEVHSGLIVLVFQRGDDPIDAINHVMSFLTAVVTFRYPTTNNQLRNSSNPRQQATINDGRLILQLIQGRQTSFAMGTTRNYTPG